MDSSYSTVPSASDKALVGATTTEEETPHVPAVCYHTPDFPKSIITVKRTRSLIIFFNTLSIVMVLLTIPVQNGSSIVLNPTNVAVPWPTDIYTLWVAMNLFSFGCGIVGAKLCKPWLIGAASVMSAADLVYFMVHGREKLVFFNYAVPAISAHLSFFELFWRYKSRAVLDPERLRKAVNWSLWVHRVVLICMNLLSILMTLSLLLFTTNEGGQKGRSCLPLLYNLGLVLSLLGCISGVLGAAMNDVALVGVAMFGNFVDIVFCLFMGHNLVVGGHKGGSEFIALTFHFSFLQYLAMQPSK